MTAGGRAEQQAQRAAARAERLERELERARRSQSTWQAGAEGERVVGERIDGMRAHGWYALHGARWPGRPKANLDHLLVGPGGWSSLMPRTGPGRSTYGTVSCGRTAASG